MEQSTVRIFHSKANMGPLSLLFTSSKRSSLFSYSLRGKQLTFIATKRNTTITRLRPPRGGSYTVSVASRIRGIELGFLTYFSTDIYLHLLITLGSQFFRCFLSNRGDKFSDPLYVKGRGCFLKVQCKFQIVRCPGS